MTRMIALAAAMAGVLAGPALAQTAQTAPATQTAPADTAQMPAAGPAVAPAPQVQTPVPDTGIKKAPVSHMRHRVHHRMHAKPADTSTPPVKATQR